MFWCASADQNTKRESGRKAQLGNIAAAKVGDSPGSKSSVSVPVGTVDSLSIIVSETNLIMCTLAGVGMLERRFYAVYSAR